jgi:hypothetical protein
MPTKHTNHRKPDLPKAVTTAIRKLRKYHALGGRLLSKYPVGTSLVEEATKRHMNRDYLASMRTFADPERGYTEQDLERLCERCEDYCRALEFSFIVRFLSIRDKRRRAKFELDVLKNGWSVTRAELELTARFGRRARAGRHLLTVNTLPQLLVTVEGKCIQWDRLNRLLREPPPTGATHITWSKLPPAFRKRFEAVVDATEQLQKLVTKHLHG